MVSSDPPSLFQIRTSEESTGKKNCILCGADSARKVLSSKDHIIDLPGIFTVVKCDCCGLCRTDPQLSEEDLAPHYADEYHIVNPPNKDWKEITYTRGWKEKIRAAYARYLYDYYTSGKGKIRHGLKLIPFLLINHKLKGTLPYNNQSKKVLDIGFGRGSFLIGAYKQGWVCYGIEVNVELCRYVQHVLPFATIVNSNVEHVEFPKSFFGFINMSHVLEHLHDPVHILKKVYRWLDPEGFLRIQVPRISPLETKLFGSYWLGWDLPRHLYHFDVDTLSRLLKKCGFKIVAVHYEANANYWIWGLKAMAKEYDPSRSTVRLLDVGNKALILLLSPLAWLLKLTTTSGRIKLLCAKTLNHQTTLPE